MVLLCIAGGCEHENSTSFNLSSTFVSTRFLPYSPSFSSREWISDSLPSSTSTVGHVKRSPESCNLNREFESTSQPWTISILSTVLEWDLRKFQEIFPFVPSTVFTSVYARSPRLKPVPSIQRSWTEPLLKLVRGRCIFSKFH